MLEELCIFCHSQMLVLRHVDDKVYQIVCVDCGACGPYGECTHEARKKYQPFGIEQKKNQPH
jgi:transcription elongation factor Elf1